MTRDSLGGGVAPVSSSWSGKAATLTGLSFARAAFDASAAVISIRALGPEGRGVFALTLTVAAIVAAAATLGLPTSCRVRLGRPGDELTAERYLSLVPLHALLGAVVAGLAHQVFVVVALGQGSEVLSLVAALLAGGLVSSTFLFDGLHGQGRHNHAASTNLVGSAVALLFTMSVAIVSDDPAVHLAALAASLFVQVVLAWRSFRPTGGASARIERWLYTRLLRDGLSALPYQLTSLATFRVDRYIVGAIAGASSLGIYSAAASLAEVCRLLPLAVGQIFVFGRSSGSMSSEDERRVRAWTIALTFVGLTFVGLASRPLVLLLFGNEFESAIWPLRILLLAEGFLAVWFIDNRLLIGSGRFAAASSTTLLSAVVVILLDISLIPTWSIAGAAWASVASYAAASILCRELLRRGGDERRVT